jgi:hypothetical protein
METKTRHEVGDGIRLVVGAGRVRSEKTTIWPRLAMMCGRDGWERRVRQSGR